MGIHSDMIKRSNDKLSEARLAQLRELALRPEAVAVMAGLDFSRDVGIRCAERPGVREGREEAVVGGCWRSLPTAMAVLAGSQRPPHPT